MFKWLKKLFSNKDNKYIKASNGLSVETDDPTYAEVVAKSFETGKIVTYSDGKITIHDRER